ncbi:MAG TPA: YcnI family protein [Candidatus Saccharimonadales bacterium]|nr:YcnI family protein [Candidatus Saccharimonadales bacterium]
MKKILGVLISGISILLFAAPAFAHVVVTPKQVGIAAWQEFSMSVPSEKDNPTIGIKLLIPNGLKNVSPNVKPGWTINEVKNGSGEGAMVTEIDWGGGSIPPGQRDDFLFQAQVPTKETTLKWKAVQTYQDGSTMSWIHDETSNPEDDSAPPPYSTTKVINDITNTQPTNSSDAGATKLPLQVSIVAISLSVASIALSLQKKRN